MTLRSHWENKHDTWQSYGLGLSIDLPSLAPPASSRCSAYSLDVLGELFLKGSEDEHEEWEVLDVVSCRKTYGVQYKARFMGNWDDWNANPSWQP
jgi:hypothetical protein